jgi:hypothetical protein
MVYLAIQWQYKWFFCKSFRSSYYFTHIYKTFIPSTDVIKSLFVREYLRKLPDGLLPDSFSVAKYKLHRFAYVNSKYGFRVCVHSRYSLYTQLIPNAMMSQSRMRKCNFRTIRMLLDRDDMLHSVFLSKEEAKNIVQKTIGKKFENWAVFFLNTSLGISPLI